MSRHAHKLLRELNERMSALHTAYEEHFWTSYMGDHSVNDDMVTAKNALDAFRADRALYVRVAEALKTARGEIREKLLQWHTFFNCYQVPAELLALRTKISNLENKVQEAQANREEGYVDPRTGKHTKVSLSQMRLIMRTHPDEAVRRACFDAIEEIATKDVAALIELVNLRNEYARALGDEDFYAYKLRIGEGMTKEELFALFGTIYERTKYGFENVRAMERERPGLRQPWNRNYLFTGDFETKTDPYLQFGDALTRWVRSFAALGINYHGATLQLDLLEREGKDRNNFCHWPAVVHFENGQRVPCRSNFATNAVPGQIGSGKLALKMLFHEGGHAAHLANVETTEVCMNHEYPPATTSWAETQSMFLDTMQSSVEWLTRYAKNASGEAYPFSLFEEEVRARQPIKPLDFMGYLMIADFERELYSTPLLTEEKVLEMARRAHQKHADCRTNSLFVLMVPHIYSWESACYYHGYGLATLALSQWREYFYRKYGYIVDNPAVGREMREVWKLGASRTFAEFVELATGEKLSADAYLAEITMSAEDTLSLARERILRLASVPEHSGPIDLGATIRMVCGKDVIADNSYGFGDMAQTYRRWIRTTEKKLRSK